MTEGALDKLYLCIRCFEPSSSPGSCPRCGRALIQCRPGDPDDPCRRPLIDQYGQVLTRAPRWYLEKTVAALMDSIEE
jgi:hypothetical protein